MRTEGNQIKFSRREAMQIGGAVIAGLASRNLLTPSTAFAQESPAPSVAPAPEISPTPSPEATTDNSQWTRIEVATVEDLQEDNWQMASWGSTPPREPQNGEVNEILASLSFLYSTPGIFVRGFCQLGRLSV